MKIKKIGFLLLIFIFHSVQSRAAEITVTRMRDEIKDDQECTLREAFIASQINQNFNGCPAGSLGNDTIIIPAGTYTFQIPADSSKPIDATTGSLDIAFEDLTIRGAGMTSTILDGAGLDILIENQGPFNVSLSQMTIKNGNGQGNGGGIGSYAGQLSLDHVIITQNHANLSGGGIYSYSNNLLVRDSIISFNTTATNDGGGLFAHGPIAITNTSIFGNTAQGSGGGIAIAQASNARFNQTSLYNNRALKDGGAIANQGTLQIKNSTLAKNISESNGGALANSIMGSFVEIYSSTISENQAIRGGGIYIENGAQASLGKSILFNNQASLLAPNARGDVISMGFNILPSIESGDLSPEATDSDSRVDPDLRPFVSDPSLPGSGYYELNSGSLAINSGTAAFECSPQDQVGHSRIDTCDSGAMESTCNNGIKEPTEQCDDGNNDNNDSCSTQCVFTHCGNGSLDENETCDDGNHLNGDGCDNKCRRENISHCGDTVLDNTEECDDGNLNDGDGCSALCKKEPPPAPDNGGSNNGGNNGGNNSPGPNSGAQPIASSQGNGGSGGCSLRSGNVFFPSLSILMFLFTLTAMVKFKSRVQNRN